MSIDPTIPIKPDQPESPRAFHDMMISDQLTAIYSILQYWTADSANQRRLLLDWQTEMEQRLNDFMEDHRAARQARADLELVAAKTNLEVKESLAGNPTNGLLTTTQRNLLQGLQEAKKKEVDWNQVYRERVIPAAVSYLTVLILAGLTSFLGWLILQFINR